MILVAFVVLCRVGCLGVTGVVYTKADSCPFALDESLFHFRCLFVFLITFYRNCGKSYVNSVDPDQILHCLPMPVL